MNEQELTAVKEEKEQMLTVINRLNIANKEQANIIAQLKIDLNDAQNRVKDLADQLNTIYTQQQVNNIS
jgi:predicted  nucleic acid-binding Zn-ribbon protein